MTIPVFRQNLFAGIAAAATALPARASLSAPKLTAQPAARQVSAPVKSHGTIEVERQAAERARIVAAAEKQRQADATAAEEKARRKAASDSVWAKAWAPRGGLPGINGQSDEAARDASGSVWAKARAANQGPAAPAKANTGERDPGDKRTATQKASDDVWARAQAKNEALNAHLNNGRTR